MPRTYTRRQILKTALAASGAVTAAAFLPAQWVKPVLQSGVLPVHAQASLLGSVSGTVVDNQVPPFPLEGATVGVYAAGTFVFSDTNFKLAKPSLLNGVGLPPPIASTTTGQDGTYLIYGQLPNNYQLRASASCFPPSIVNITITAGSTTVQNFQLEGSGC